MHSAPCFWRFCGYWEIPETKQYVLIEKKNYSIVLSRKTTEVQEITGVERPTGFSMEPCSSVGMAGRLEYEDLIH